MASIYALEEADRLEARRSRNGWFLFLLGVPILFLVILGIVVGIAIAIGAF